MADISTIPSVRLQVAAARQEESGNGFARLPRSALSALGVTEGDVIEIEGNRINARDGVAIHDMKVVTIMAIEESEIVLVETA